MSLINWFNSDTIPITRNSPVRFRDTIDSWPFPQGFRSSFPAVNVSENDKFYTLEMAVPGKTKKDFDLNVEDGVLSISSESESRSDEVDKNYTRQEYNYSSFYRSFKLPSNVDPESIKARYEDGLLVVTIGKVKEAAPEKKSVEVN